jgi:hypothetical protein
MNVYPMVIYYIHFIEMYTRHSIFDMVLSHERKSCPLQELNFALNFYYINLGMHH